MSARPIALAFVLSLCAAASSCKLYPAPEPGTLDGLVLTQRMMAIVKHPDGYDSARTYPLLVALHGNGGTAESFAPVFGSVAQQPVLVAVPQGEFEKPTGGYSWFFETEDRSLWEEYDTRSVNDLVELIGTVRARYRTGKVFLLGFSQGVSLAYMVAFLHPSLVTGVIAVAGYLPSIDQEGSIVHAQDVANAQGVDLLIARGADDELVSRTTWTNQVQFFVGRGYAVTSLEFAGGHYVTPMLLGDVMQWVRSRAER